MIRSAHKSFPVPILAMGVLLLALGVSWLRLSSPSDGTRLEPDEAIWRSDGVAVGLLQHTPGRLLAGDVVVAIDGEALEARAAKILGSNQQGTYHTGQTVRYTVRRGSQVLEVPVTLDPYAATALLASNWGLLTTLLAIQLMATFVLMRRPRDPAARLFFLSWSWIVAALITALAGLQIADFAAPTAFTLYWLSMGGAHLFASAVFLHLVLVWPRPHPAVVRRWWLIPLVYVGAIVIGGAALLVSKISNPDSLTWMGTWEPIGGTIELVAGVLAIVALVTSYYHSPRGSRDRVQIQWVLFGLAFTFALGLLLGALPLFLSGQPMLDRNPLALVGLPLPLCVAVAVLRYRLFDIDLLINRTLVYGVLSGIIVVLYVGGVGYASALFQVRDNLGISLLATAAVAMLFQPLRARLQRLVNQLMYGERDEPYAVLSRLGQRLEAAVAPSALLPAVVETVATALKLPYAAIALQSGPASEVAASMGHPAGELLRWPLVHQGETIGDLLVSARRPGEGLSAADRLLLADIARQASGAAYAVRLNADLQRSRESLVAAREEERRRLRRDLHDGLGPRLAGLALRIDTVRNRLANDPRADPLLDGLQEQTEAAITDVRRLVEGLRPPVLDQLGLLSALHEHTSSLRHNGLQVTLEAPDCLPPLPAAVEVAAYRIATEALTNVLRHARAHLCRVRIALDGALELAIVDDGIGLPVDYRAGVGLVSMRERAAELGGTCTIERTVPAGTSVLARLPLPTEEV